MIRLPGLIDPHVHTRDPGQTHKEDFGSATASAIAGGFTMILAMPNTSPPLEDKETFDLVSETASLRSRCDYGLYAVATDENADTVHELAGSVCGLKVYLDATFGKLLLEDGRTIEAHIANWPSGIPIVFHAEGGGRLSIGYAIGMAALYRKPIHIAHVARRDEILLIRKAKERGLPVTCETSPHYLLFSHEDRSRMPEGFFEVRPSVGSAEDREALWQNLEFIDCFATDHAPHTIPEKRGEGGNPPTPGFPGLETALGVLLRFVDDGQLEIEDLETRLYENPRRIFGLPEQEETYVDVDEDEEWTVDAEELFTKARWSPFEGLQLKGKVRQVTLRGQVVFDGEDVVAPPGAGRNVISRGAV